jgi:glycosyltransferase involved in cell wall biosynthesis
MSEMMPTTLRVAHISPAYGGVANAARRLHLGLLKIGVESRLFLPDDTAPRGLFRMADVPSKFMYKYFGVNGLLHMSSLFWRFSEFNVVHLHGGDSSGFNLHALNRLNRDHALVYTMHDKHFGTGACGYPEFWDCPRWQTGCGHCPKAKSDGWMLDLTHVVFERKQRILDAIQMGVVAPNQWMFDFIAASPITHHQVLRRIAYGVDVELFCPRPASRLEFGLPAAGRLLLTVASKLGQARKGMQYYPALLSALRQQYQDEPVGLVLVGAKIDDARLAELNTILPVYVLGQIDDPGRLAQIYSTVDFSLVTSTIDNFPNVILESLACGTPAAAFRVGGIPDMILPGHTGVLADLGDTQTLATQISELLKDSARLADMRLNCRNEAVSKFSLEIQATQYADLYRDLMHEKALS